MEKEVCKVNMTVERVADGSYYADGHLEFHGNGMEKCIVVAQFLDAIEFPTGLPGMAMLAKAFSSYERLVEQDNPASEAERFVEEAKEWH